MRHLQVIIWELTGRTEKSWTTDYIFPSKLSLRMRHQCGNDFLCGCASRVPSATWSRKREKNIFLNSRIKNMLFLYSFLATSPNFIFSVYLSSWRLNYETFLTSAPPHFPAARPLTCLGHDKVSWDRSRHVHHTGTEVKGTQEVGWEKLVQPASTILRNWEGSIPTTPPTA